MEEHILDFLNFVEFRQKKNIGRRSKTKEKNALNKTHYNCAYTYKIFKTIVF